MRWWPGILVALAFGARRLLDAHADTWDDYYGERCELGMANASSSSIDRVGGSRVLFQNGTESWIAQQIMLDREGAAWLGTLAGLAALRWMIRKLHAAQPQTETTTNDDDGASSVTGAGSAVGWVAIAGCAVAGVAMDGAAVCCVASAGSAAGVVKAGSIAWVVAAGSANWSVTVCSTVPTGWSTPSCSSAVSKAASVP